MEKATKTPKKRIPYGTAAPHPRYETTPYVTPLSDLEERIREFAGGVMNQGFYTYDSRRTARDLMILAADICNAYERIRPKVQHEMG